MDKVVKLATDCLEKPWPDLTIILDVDSATAATRLKSNLDRMEQKGDNYHKKVRDGFLKIAKQQKNFVVVNAGDNIEAVHKKITETIEKFGAK
jgi:dTMP kinase